MKCNCSSINKYEIIGLCDIQKFNEKIKEFKDKSWTQVVLSDNVIPLGVRPSIKTITKTFIDVKITSTKLINTPKSQEPSVEGLTLTGKLLLVAGEINQRILYISNCGRSDRINAFKTKSQFTTYIVIGENVDIAQDKFCIYPCIEYSSIRPINECMLNQNVTLFLFAHKTNNPNPNPPVPPGPEPGNPYPNEVIFKNDGNEELARVVFNTRDKTLTVTNTENVQTRSVEVILEFEVFDSDGVTRRERGQIVGNRKATQFVSDLNGKSFNYEDIIKVTYYRNPQRVKITNYPTQGAEYQPTAIAKEYFVVTQNGLVQILPNRIIANNGSNQKVVEVSFINDAKKIKVISTGNRLNNSIGSWSLFVMLADSTGMIKYVGQIQANQDGGTFKNSLDGTDYSIGDLVYIETGTRNITHTKVTNYPNEGNTYSLNQPFKAFEITNSGLEEVDNDYPNEISLRTSSGEQFAKLVFLSKTKKISFKDINLNVMEVGNQSDMIIEVKLYRGNGTLKRQKDITQGINIEDFITNMKGIDFEYGYTIEINSTDNQNRIQISKFPTNRDTYTPTKQVETFSIGANRLTKVNS